LISGNGFCPGNTDQKDYNEQYLILEKQTAYENDDEGFWKLVADYIERNLYTGRREDENGNRRNP